MVRDPGNRFKENSSLVTFVEERRCPAASDGTYLRTPKMNQATVEPSDVPHDFLTTLYPENLQHPEKSKAIHQVKAFLNHFQSVFAYQQH